MITVEQPAGLHHLVLTLSEGASMPPAYWRSWIGQVNHGPSAAFLDEQGQLLAVAGLYPKGKQLDFLWFCATPMARRRMVALLRVFRLTLLKSCESRNVTVRAFIASGWRPTARLLALLGFHYSGQVPGFDVWDTHFGGRA